MTAARDKKVFLFTTDQPWGPTRLLSYEYWELLPGSKAVGV
jgi:hypothetical protein